MSTVLGISNRSRLRPVSQTLVQFYVWVVVVKANARISVSWVPPLHRSPVPTSLCPCVSSPSHFIFTSLLVSVPILPRCQRQLVLTGVPSSVSFGVSKVSRSTAQASVPLSFLIFFQVPGPHSHPLSPHLDSVSLLNRAVTLLPAYHPALEASFDQLVT